MVDVQDTNGTVTVTVTSTDRITVLNAGEIKGVLIENINKETTKDVSLDLHNIKFMDSTGISVLISGIRASRETGHSFKLKSVQTDVLKLLVLMKIDKILDIEK